MKSAQFVTISVVTALIIPVSVAIATGSPSQFFSQVASEITISSIVAATWGYSGRTLSGIDGLAMAVWDHSSQIKNLGKLLVVETLSDPAPDLTNKLNSTDAIVTQLNFNYQKVAGGVGLLGLRWASLPASEAAQSLDELVSILDSDQSLPWLTKAWGWPELATVTSQSTQAKESLLAIRQTVASLGMQQVAYLQLKSALHQLEAVQTLVGQSSDSVPRHTVFGRAKHARELAESGKSQQDQLATLVADWDKISSQDQETRLDQAIKEVLAINQIPQAAAALAAEPRNKMLDLLALIAANQTLLAQDAGTPVVETWLEAKPVVVRTLVANPAAAAQYQVAVKYYLPPQITPGDILGQDGDLKVAYDEGRKQYLVTANLDLAAADTRTLALRVADRPAVLGQQTAALSRWEQIISQAQSKFLKLDALQLMGGGLIVITAGGLLFFLASRKPSAPPIPRFRGLSDSIASSDL